MSSSSNSSTATSRHSTQRIPVVQRLFGANSPPRKSLLSDKDDSNSFMNKKTEVANGLECFNGKEAPSASTLSDFRMDDWEEFVPSHQKRTVKWFNQKLNKRQKSAVLNILKGEARPLPYIIFGPPGTGKTVTVVEAILQILHLVPESRILVATPSNSSADLIAERVLDLAPLNPGELVRLIALHCLEDGKIPSCLMPYCTTGIAGRSEDNDEEVPNVPEFGKKLRIPMSAASLGRHRITIGTCVALGQLHALGLPKGHFTHVFLDETGQRVPHSYKDCLILCHRSVCVFIPQSTEPEALIPLGFLSTSADIGWGQAILAGDPRQLGPVVISKLANHLGLGQSLLARILTTSPYAPDPIGYPDKSNGHHNPSVVTRLVVNYRSVPKLLSLTSDMFYDGTLIPTVSPLYGPEGQLLLKMAKHLPPMKCSEELKEVEIASPLVFHGVRGEEARLADSPSWYNPMEAVQCLEYMKILYHLAELSPSDIGIITPYVEQVKTIRNLLGDNCLPLPKVGTVEEFQGQERLVILLSCVRTSQSQIAVDLVYALGFVSSSNRMNVATSRARALLIILGDPHLLQHDPLWNKVIIRCLESESYIGCDLPNSFSKCVNQSEEPKTAEESSGI
ncbi:hypothetical protein J437_LFUL004232 [Ladona fulva]|uniref:RNA helicase n=1 Tax=Ladona fulva TaxID=123851 RepID=A0A8K0K3G6_LADFU|nr:hypothetical protein J437_LFUL004232 [Ladona fulva]